MVTAAALATLAGLAPGRVSTAFGTGLTGRMLLGERPLSWAAVEEYVRAAHDAGLREVRLIHGRGIGVQRGIVQSVLEQHPLVASFHDAPESHLGATVAVLIE